LDIAGRDVLAADENLAIAGNLDFDAGKGLPDRPFFRAERMIEADDGRGFGESVTLNDHEPELLPERFELRIERRCADDERPELEAEQAMHAAVPPPADGHVARRSAFPAKARREAVERRPFRRAGAAHGMFAQDVANLRDRNEHRHAARPDP